MKNIFLLFVVIFGFTIGITAQSSYTLPSYWTYSLNSSDLDLDGDLDILIGSRNGYNNGIPNDNISFTIFKDKGDNIYEISDTSKQVGTQYNIFAVRIDEDEYPDLVTKTCNCNEDNEIAYVRIWYNDGKGNFNDYRDFSLGVESISNLFFGDANGDGLTDIFIHINHMSVASQWGVMYNTGNGNLSEPVYHIYPTDLAMPDIAIGDLNNDGMDDVVSATTGNGGNLYIYYSTGDAFREYALPDVWASYIKIVDFDGDGFNDIAAITDIVPPVQGYPLELLNILRNNGNEEFESLYPAGSEIPCYYFIQSFDMKDMNNDGLPDWVCHVSYSTTAEYDMIVNDKSGIRILYNLGDFKFKDPEDYYNVKLNFYGESKRKVHIADFNNDGIYDICTARDCNINKPEARQLDILYGDGYGMYIEDDNIVSGNVAMAFPNPGNDVLNIQTSLQNASVMVYDIFGRVVYKQDITENITSIPTERWNRGMYLWKVYNNEMVVESGKWVKR